LPEKCPESSVCFPVWKPCDPKTENCFDIVVKCEGSCPTFPLKDCPEGKSCIQEPMKCPLNQKCIKVDPKCLTNCTLIVVPNIDVDCKNCSGKDCPAKCDGNKNHIQNSY